MNKKITLRPEQSSDRPFLLKLFGTTRAQEMAQSMLPPAAKAKFLESQFNAQHSSYRHQFPQGKFDIVLYKKKPIGRLYINLGKEELRMIDLSILPAYRGKGIGSQIFDEVLKQGKAANVPVRLHVMYNNPAYELYKRLGFRKIADDGPYYVMECLPGSSG